MTTAKKRTVKRLDQGRKGDHIYHHQEHAYASGLCVVPRAMPFPSTMHGQQRALLCVYVLIVAIVLGV